ncbi:MAG: ATP-binding protein, partial [Campylobacterota bacterium]
SLDKTSDENEEIIYLLNQYKEAIDKKLIVSTSDVTGKIKYVNDNFCRISGYSEEELLGQDHNIVRHPSNPDKVFKEMWGTILNKEVWQGTIPNMAKDGSTYYVNATIVPFTNIYGEIVEFMALREDVTKTIEYQNEIQTEKHRVSEILNNQESVIVLFGKESGVIEANKKFFELFGFTSLSDFKSKYDCVCELFEEKEGFLTKGEGEDLWSKPVEENPNKLHLAMIDKRVYSVKVTQIEVDDKDTFLATFTDITEIEEARKKSQEAEKEKANFLANMSHEIRTPMNAILGFSELLAKTELNHRQKKFIELIKNSSVTLIQIINDILDFSKLESGQTDIKMVEINPFMEFEETFMLLAQKAKEKDISYMIKIDSRLNECIEIDSFHIKQVMMNLIGNAIKFTPSHGTVDIRIEKKSVENQNIIGFSVQDTGIGIPKGRQEKIFDPFSQADSSTTREFGGTGLGLSISNSLVSIMGTKLQLESQEGVGSKFSFDVKYEECLCKHSLKSHLEEFNVYLCDFKNKYLSSITKQLKEYDIEFKTIKVYDADIDLPNSIVIHTEEHSVDIFKHAKKLLVTDSEDAQSQYSINRFEEFPSLIYNELM